MQKVYFSNSAEETAEIISKIYASGYKERVILQDTIPGGDSNMRVLTIYSDRNREPKMLCLGHVLLEEHTPKGRGNHAAIITEKAPDICEKIKAMLRDVGYTGFANFDIKYDSRDGIFKVFEINLRQGRSNHYITASGINIAKLVVDDRVLCENMPYIEQEKEFFWHSVPKKIVFSYTEDENAVERCKALCRENKEAMPFVFSYDLRFNPLRSVFVFENLRRQFKKYSTYCKKIR
jgi:D-aspartate ligase